MTPLARQLFERQFPTIAKSGLVIFPPTSTEVLLQKYPKAVLAKEPTVTTRNLPADIPKCAACPEPAKSYGSGNYGKLCPACQQRENYRVMVERRGK